MIADLYKILGVSRNVKQAGIRKAYIILSKVHMQRIFEVLSAIEMDLRQGRKG